MFFRILIMILVGLTNTRFFIPLVGCAILVLHLLTAVFQPYKANAHNRINIVFLIVMLFIVISAMAITLSLSDTVQAKHFAKALFVSSICFPGIYNNGVILHKLFAHRLWVQNLYKKLCKVCIKREEEDFERLLPERMVNVDECAALLADPMEVNT